MKLGAPCAAVLAVTLSACGARALDDRPPQPPIAPSSSSLTRIWIDTEHRPIAPPVAIGGLAVAIVSAPERQAFLVGIDPASGRIRWQQPLTQGRIEAGIDLHVHKVDGDKVAYYRPTHIGKFPAQLVIADASTGHDLMTSPETTFVAPLTWCFGDPEHD